MTWNIEKSISFLDKHALPKSTSNCAKFVRLALAEGGVVLQRTLHAKDYGSGLTAAGFIALSSTAPPFLAGDVAVIQAIPHHPDGHMCMFDGNIWVCDFKQLHGFYPGDAYRRLRPPAVIYR